MDKNGSNTEAVKVYRRRFGVLFTVAVLNISNGALWISYSPVASTVADFYEVSVQKINWFSSVYLIATVPFAFVSTYITDKVGLKFVIHLGAYLNCGGAIVRAMGTSALFLDPSVQYAVSLTGQVTASMAQSCVLFILTKVSQLWFPETERTIATTAIALANPLGILLGQGITPFIVTDKSDVPLNNYIWMGVAIFSMISTLIFVTKSKPDTAPSTSAEKEGRLKASYWSDLKTVFTSVPYLLQLLSLGAGIGCFNAISTLTEQIISPLGYSDIFGGISNVVLVFFGFAGSFTSGFIVMKTKLFLEITKLFTGLATIFLMFMLEFYLVPDQKVAILLFSALFGFFGIGTYSIGLELAVETTYPVEETVSSAFIFLSGQLQGLIGIIIIPALATPLPKSKDFVNGKENDLSSEKLDYSLPLLLVMSYISLLTCIMILFMNTKYKRLEAENVSGELTPSLKYRTDVICTKL